MHIRHKQHTREHCFWRSSSRKKKKSRLEPQEEEVSDVFSETEPE